MQFLLLPFNVTNTKSELGAIASSQKAQLRKTAAWVVLSSKTFTENPWLVAIALSSDFVHDYCIVPGVDSISTLSQTT